MNQEEKLQNLRHSASHLLAAAVLVHFPQAKLTLGPPIDNGFYYDFDFGSQKVSEHDLLKIEETMYTLVKGWKSFERQEVTVDEARELYKQNEYKRELISEHSQKGDTLTLYRAGEFTDLCRGGHCEHPAKELKHFKLLSIAGAYWRGDEKNTMLTRIYGTAFPTKEELDTYLWQQEEAKKRDHRKLGRDLDLFTFSDLVGSGLPLYTPNGALIRRLLNAYVEDIQKEEAYTQVWTPQIAKAELFKKSGHYDKYHEDMFRVVSNYTDDEMYLKPMNCPQHTQIYASRPRSYRDLPIRFTDFAMLYRDERPGELNGLARVRSFSQDDCHVFCTEEQVDAEIDRMLSMTKRIMDTFGFTYRYRLSTRDPAHPEKYYGDPLVWDKVEAWAVKIMQRNNIPYFDGPGEAAFYAPKMDLMATDALGREWQLSTVQIDYVQPARFELTYTDSTGKQKTPIMLHRAIIGSTERMLMVLLEHYAGNFPLWLSPVQVGIVPIAERHGETAALYQTLLRKAGIRTTVDSRSEPMGAKIRDFTLQKVPYIGIIGDKEVESASLSVRTRRGENLKPLSVVDFITRLTNEIEHKS